MRKTFFLFFFLLILIVPNVLAEKIIQSAFKFDEGFVIKYPPFNFMKQNEPFDFKFHVYNISNGVPIVEGISCDFDLYNSTGIQFYKRTVSSVDILDYNFDMEGGNFSKLGDYGYVISCNNSLLGGYDVVPFTVNQSGTEEESSYFLLLLFLLPLIIGFFTLLGSFFLGDDHKALKIGLFLFSFITFFASIWLAYIIVAMQFPNMEGLQNALGFLTYTFGLIILVIIVYFMLYIFKQAIGQASDAPPEAKDLNY